MPKFSYDEETLREYAEYAGEDLPSEIDIEAEIAAYKREPNGRLSFYKAATCALDEDKVSKTSRAVLQELRALDVTQLVVRYDGGGDEGFAHFGEVKTTGGYFSAAHIIALLKNGPLEEKQAQTATYYWPERETQLTREDWAQDALQLLSYELAQQLLGKGYGVGEMSLEGAFIADLQANTLTDIPPTENT